MENLLDIRREKFLEELTKRPDILYQFSIEKLEICYKSLMQEYFG